jgi:biotin-(acetyl-CoA carboxylase) ligase
LNEEFSFSTLNLTNINHQELSHKLCSYILSHRLSDKEIMDSFNLLCVHMNKYVEVSEDDKKFQGKFLEIGKHGEARILINNEVKNFYSARLLIHN